MTTERTIAALVLFLLVPVAGHCEEASAYRLRVDDTPVARLSTATPAMIVGPFESNPTRRTMYPIVALTEKPMRDGECLLARRGRDCIAIVSVTSRNPMVCAEPVFSRRPFRGGERLYRFRIERTQLTATQKQEEALVSDLVKQLGDVQFQKRDAASRELEKHIPFAVPILEKAAGDADPEVKVRAQEILAKAGGKAMLPPESELLTLLGGKAPLNGAAPFLGIQMQPYSAEGVSGVQVQQVVADTSAGKAGVIAGDVVLKLDGKEVANSEDLYDLIQGHEPGEEVILDILRDKKNLKMTVKLGARPGDQGAVPQQVELPDVEE